MGLYFFFGFAVRKVVFYMAKFLTECFLWRTQDGKLSAGIAGSCRTLFGKGTL